MNALRFTVFLKAFIIAAPAMAQSNVFSISPSPPVSPPVVIGTWKLAGDPSCVGPDPATWVFENASGPYLVGSWTFECGDGSGRFTTGAPSLDEARAVLQNDQLTVYFGRGTYRLVLKGKTATGTLGTPKGTYSVVFEKM